MLSVRAVAKVAALVPVVAIGIPAQWAVLRFGLGHPGAIPWLFHRIVCRVLGIRRVVTGHPPNGEPALILANHVSWLDITVIGSLMPLSFVAKSEIAGWPLFGLFAKLQRSVFIDRTRRSATAVANETIAHRLKRGEAIVLFAEGTTGDGHRLLPFRSALVGAARDALADPDAPRIALKPLSIAYVRRHGLPLGRAGQPHVAWYGDMDLLPHLKAILADGPIDVHLAWGESIPFDAETDRKAVTRRAERAVRATFRAALRGRD
ncbi:lysophospholipid acyltransferase family protein [Chelatococcus sp. SYSU_G07232]|uniref:Lysophospholipid acyltransferase family protein n=1 Tax=Chelatococcus albus TaxID=3047466 RepID=A0ABT7AH96_9HYPH|nr:lysophospholipid acyltransferase family protein [Chelatococcus sp. SYSU_G07232]MDJ1158747.1 lysophospholipid acyltransferase family protein [Chelatococcus sp. SYSU_G07232]